MDPKVSIIMGSTSDLPVMEKAAKVLNDFCIPFEINALSAHRTPAEVESFAKNAQKRGIEVIIAGAGMAGRIACLQDGDLLGFGLQNGVVWFGGAHPEQRQADAEHEGTDKQAAAQWAQPWKFGKKSVHAYRPPQGGDCPSCDVVLGRHFSIQKPPISILKSAAKAPAGSLLLPGATGKSLAAAHTIRSEKAAVIQVF